MYCQETEDNDKNSKGTKVKDPFEKAFSVWVNP